jgi:hypothetical protein
MKTIDKHENAQLRIMSSNIWGDGGGHGVADRDYKLAGVYLRYLPDVLGLQEVTPLIRDEPIPLFDPLRTYYEEVEVDIVELTNNFTALLYRKDKFSIVDKGFFNYSGKSKFKSKAVTWAVLESKDFGGRFAVCNTHFY